MARNISEVSIFGEYKQPENRLTAAFLQILKIGGEPLIREVAHRIGFSIPSSEIDIFTQVKEEASVPDGTAGMQLYILPLYRIVGWQVYQWGTTEQPLEVGAG